MNIQDRLQHDMKQAMRNREKERLSVIRSVKAALQNETIKTGNDLSLDEVLTVLNREMKQRKESLHEFEQANRQDLSNKMIYEIEILSHYLPKQLTEEELQAIVEETITETGASSKAEMGKVMGEVMPKVKGQADGTQVKKLVEKSLS